MWLLGSVKTNQYIARDCLKRQGGGGAGGARIVSRFKGGRLGAGKKEGVVFWKGGSLIPHCTLCRALSLSPEYLSNLLSKLYIPRWLGKIFICCSDYWKMHLQIKKLNLKIFTQAPPGKIIPKVLIITSRLRQITHYSLPYTAVFFWKCFPQQREGDFVISIFWT